MGEHIYLSPHLDDAVLSCGGQIAGQTRAGERVTVVTAFAGDPPSPLSIFAGLLHERWGLGDDAPAARRAEDRAALALLGAVPLHWELPDCIYRTAPDGTPLYPDPAALWGPLQAADGSLADGLARRIATLPETATLWAPLGAGGHVDHCLLRRAAEAAGRPLYCYEEYPYAETPQMVERALGDGPWMPRLTFLDEEALAAKIAAAACYRSQISTFWADVDDMAARIRAYALQVGEGRPAERAWRVTL